MIISIFYFVPLSFPVVFSISHCCGCIPVSQRNGDEVVFWAVSWDMVRSETGGCLVWRCVLWWDSAPVSQVFSSICILDFSTVKKGSGTTWYLRSLAVLKVCCPSSRGRSIDGFLFLQFVNNSTGLNIFVQSRMEGETSYHSSADLLRQVLFSSSTLFYTSPQIFYPCLVVQKNE